MSQVDPERFFTAGERRTLLKKKAAEKAARQRDLEDDFIWQYIDLGGDEW